MPTFVARPVVRVGALVAQQIELGGCLDLPEFADFAFVVVRSVAAYATLLVRGDTNDGGAGGDSDEGFWRRNVPNWRCVHAVHFPRADVGVSTFDFVTLGHATGRAVLGALASRADAQADFPKISSASSILDCDREGVKHKTRSNVHGPLALDSP